MTSPIGALAGAVAKVMSEVHGVVETGHNREQNYKFASDEDLLRALQPAMARNGLTLHPHRMQGAMVEHSPTKSGARQWRYDVLVTYHLTHTSGELVEVQAVGSGIDFGDKAPFKAMTGALKYALRQTFLVPTGEDAERTPEADPGPPTKTEQRPPKKAAPKGLAHDEVEPFRIWLAARYKKDFVPLVDLPAERAEQFHTWRTTTEAQALIETWHKEKTP